MNVLIKINALEVIVLVELFYESSNGLNAFLPFAHSSNGFFIGHAAGLQIQQTRNDLQVVFYAGGEFLSATTLSP